jgi:large subunit ribosomal protein L24
MKTKIRRGDRVMAIAGNDRGKIGVVQLIKEDCAVVQGFNIRKRHTKPRSGGVGGGIFERERPVHLSNLRIVSEGDIPRKLRITKDHEGNRALAYREGDQEVIYRSIKQSRG